MRVTRPVSYVTMTPGAVVIGAHANGLGVIRSLGSRGVPVASIPTRPFDVAHRSRWVRDIHPLPQFHDCPGTLVDLLVQQADRWRGWAIFPTHDDALTVVATHHATLSRHYRLTVPPWDRAASIVDKDRMHRLAIDAGLDVPHCHGAATHETAATIGAFPVIVKPVQHGRVISRFGAKLFVARTPAELRDAVEALSACGVAGLIYDVVPGADDDIYAYGVYIARDGRPSPGLTIRKLRQYPAAVGGACAARVVDDVAGLREATVALARRADFQGLVFAEFKRDRASGRMRFIEVNGRAVLFNALAAHAGADLVAFAWEDVTGARLPSARPLRPARVWVHLQADVLRAAAATNGNRVGMRRWLAPYFARPVDAIFAWRDPMPFLVQTWRAIRTLPLLLHRPHRAKLP